MRVVLGVLVLALASLLGAGSAFAAFDPVYEQQNYSKHEERGKRDAADAEFQALLRRKGLENQVAREEMRVSDPERDPSGNLCANKMDGCAGDVRVYDWAASGFGLRTPVLWTARNGATISGNVWMTRAGPAKRPGVVITNGSVQAPEELYWGQAAVLAKRGYVVLTWDPQGQGSSDTNGEGADRNEGVPSQSGRPFFDGTEDALDFFLSTPTKRFVPRPSCTTGTSHAPKHERRVEAGLNAAHNPMWEAVDPTRIGIAGHSFGAAGVSFVGQKDPRVDAVVGWDDLRASSQPAASDCASAPESRVPAATPTKPGLGISNDYGLFRMPNTSEPDPMAKGAVSRSFAAAGVDSGELVIRGGTHYESSYIPNPQFGATLRGIDLVAWYTAAWFDRYVKGDVSAERLLLTDRWRADPEQAAVDPTQDGNVLSRYSRSRMDIGRSGGRRVVCEDLRAGCAELGPDGEPAGFGYLRTANTPDVPGAGDRGLRPGTGPAGARRCAKSRRARVRLPRRVARRAARVTVFVDGERRRSVSGRRVRAAKRRVAVRVRPRPNQGRRLPRRAKVRLVVRLQDGGRRVVVRRVVRCARVR